MLADRASRGYRGPAQWQWHGGYKASEVEQIILDRHTTAEETA
jgi:hypothetical protein